MDYQQIQERIENEKKLGTLNSQWFQDNFTLEERIQMLNTSNYFFSMVGMMFQEEELYASLDQFPEFPSFICAYQAISDAKKLLYLFQLQNAPDGQDIIESLIYYIQSDDYRLEAVRLLEDNFAKVRVIVQLQSDQKKQEVLSSYHGALKAEIIASMKSDEEKKKYIRLSPNLDVLISSLESDELRRQYLQKYRFVLSSDAKVRIISSFHSDEIKLEYLKQIQKEEQRVEIICTLSPKLALEFLPTITNTDARSKILDSLDSETLVLALPHLDFEEAYPFLFQLPYDRYKLPFLGQCSKEQREEVLGSFRDTSLFLENVMLLEDFDKIEELISHREKFPPYLDSYQPLESLFASHYGVSKERLHTLIELTSMQCLTYMKNQNIQNLLRLPEEDFQKMMILFQQDKTSLKENTLNDILHSLLQREFRIQNASLVSIFPQCLAAIEGKDVETLGHLLAHINSTYPFLELLSEQGMNQQEFIHELLEKKEDAFNLLHQITEKYLTFERNQYAQDHLEDMRRKCLKQCFEKNALIKASMATISWEQLSFTLDNISRDFFSKEDQELIENVPLLKEVFEFKQNPSTYSKEVTKEMKQALKTYQHIFRVLADRKLLSSRNAFKMGYELPEKDSQFLLSILGEMNIEHLLTFSKEKPELYQTMLHLLEKYQFMAWGESFSNFLVTVDLYYDASTVANFINNFSEFYPKLQSSVERGEISGITITGLIDQANCYGSDSYRYAQIFEKENYQLLSSNPGPNSACMPKKKRLEIALEDVKELYARDSIPVPPIQREYTLPNGKSIYVEVGNVTDLRNLTLGERTGACMRIGGAGSSLFDFCLKDPNGFHITFSNPKTGELISRVSGFQNGNCCCLNQLRDSLSSEYTDQDLVEVCKRVAHDFVEMSKENANSIDCVIISDYYAMTHSNEPKRNLHIEDIKKGLGNFYSDVSANAIVLAEKKGSKIQLGKDRVNRYEPSRSLPKEYRKESAIEPLNHMESLHQLLNGTAIDEIELPSFDHISICYVGVDWYAALKEDGEILSTIFEQGDMKKAQAEMEVALTNLQAQRNYQGGYQR